MIKAYFDGSRYDGRGIKLLCLGGVVASETVWPDFNQKWRVTLQTYGLTSFHMTDAMAHRGDFDGWETVKIDDLLKALTNIVGGFFDRHLRVKSCVVNLDDYQKANTDVPRLKNPEAICVDFCCGTPVPPEEATPVDQQHSDIIFCFDKNESFLKFIDQAWRRRRKRRRGGWPEQVRNVLKASSTQEPGLQAADLIAWSTNAVYRGVERAYPYVWLNVLMGMHAYFDYGQILEEVKKGRLVWNRNFVTEAQHGDKP
jgi:hypothetical protein